MGWKQRLLRLFIRKHTSIRDTLQNSSLATFSVLFPDPAMKGMTRPIGTGFFVSADGWFVTAPHVVMEGGKIRPGIEQCQLEKERIDEFAGPGAGCQFITLEYVDEQLDLALLKVDFKKTNQKLGW